MMKILRWLNMTTKARLRQNTDLKISQTLQVLLKIQLTFHKNVIKSTNLLIT